MSPSSRKLNHHWKCTEQKKISENLGDNILELYHVLVQIQVATSKANLDIYYNKLGIRVPSRVAKRRKT